MSQFYATVVTFFCLILRATQLLMNFSKVFSGVTECDCLQGSTVDFTNVFVRRIFSESPNLEDFKSWHDIGKIPKDNCEDICGFRGISVNICSEETKHAQIEKYKKAIIQRKKINSEVKIPEFGLFFTFKDSAGRIKQTGKDVTHFDFYRCDEFDLSSLLSLEIINLAS